MELNPYEISVIRLSFQPTYVEFSEARLARHLLEIFWSRVIGLTANVSHFREV